VVNFIFQLLIPGGRAAISVEWERLSGYQSWSGHFGARKKLLRLPDSTIVFQSSSTEPGHSLPCPNLYCSALITLSEYEVDVSLKCNK
jgi:hypothetical protein